MGEMSESAFQVQPIDPTFGMLWTGGGGCYAVWEFRDPVKAQQQNR